jgi:hypothetical protein
MRAPAPCYRIHPATGEVIEILKGRSYQPSKTKFLRRHWTPAALRLAAEAALARFGEAAATPATPPGEPHGRPGEAE